MTMDVDVLAARFLVEAERDQEKALTHLTQLRAMITRTDEALWDRRLRRSLNAIDDIIETFQFRKPSARDLANAYDTLSLAMRLYDEVSDSEGHTTH